jgi:hypothetical protein
MRQAYSISIPFKRLVVNVRVSTLPDVVAYCGLPASPKEEARLSGRTVRASAHWLRWRRTGRNRADATNFWSQNPVSKCSGTTAISRRGQRRSIAPCLPNEPTNSRGSASAPHNTGHRIVDSASARNFRHRIVDSASTDNHSHPNPGISILAANTAHTTIYRRRGVLCDSRKGNCLLLLHSRFFLLANSPVKKCLWTL